MKVVTDCTKIPRSSERGARQMCPECMNHAADIMSRVTGYLQIVSGWNAAKKQEFEDRKRHRLQ